MSKFMLSKALGAVPDDMLQEAMEVKKKRSTSWTILRAAACLAVVLGLLIAALGGNSGVITGPGILVVTVYAAEETPFTISSPDTVLHNSIYWDSASSYSFGCPITLSVSDEYDYSEEITFQVAIDGGGMLAEEKRGDTFTPGTAYRYMPPQFTVPNHTTIRWTDIHPYTESNEYSMVDRNTAHVEIVIYDGIEIIGYTVLRLSKMNCSEVISANSEWIFASNHTECTGEHMINCYRIQMLASVFFPKTEGEYQVIEEEYVCEQIAKVKRR